MSDDAKQDEPPMAALHGTRLPGGPPASSGTRILMIAMLAVIAVLILLLLNPVKLDVYRGLDNLEIADPVLKACVIDFARANQWSDVGHIVSLRCNNPADSPITRLDGIEHLVELADVNLAFNAISDATPLAQLPYGVNGWVRNKRDGTVEAVIEGERQKVASMLDWCREGPDRAVVNQVDVEWEDYTGEMVDFRVTH